MPLVPPQRKSAFASFTRLAMAPKSRLPNSYSMSSTACRPRFFITSRAPAVMWCTEGNLLVTMATVFGALGSFAAASKIRLGQTVSGSNALPETGNCISYLASRGMPNEVCSSSLL